MHMKLTVKDYLWNLDLLVPTPVWRFCSRMRHPVRTYQDWSKWRDRPQVGDWVEDCRYRVLRVVTFDEASDTITFYDGSTASWMHCCDWPSDEWGPRNAPEFVTYGDVGTGSSYLYGKEPGRTQPTSEDKIYDIRTGREIKRG